MGGVSPFLVVSLPLIAVVLLTSRPYARYQRPRLIALVLFIAVTGLAAKAARSMALAYRTVPTTRPVPS